MSDLPQRAYEVRISISADDWDGVISALRSILFSTQEDGPGREQVLGGHSYSFIFVDNHNSAQTHEGYFERVDEWLASEQAARAALKGGK